MECLRGKFTAGVLLNGRYKTVSPLNQGSYGMVIVAHDLQTDESVAIKCLTKRSASQESNFDFAIDDKSEEFALHSRFGAHSNIVNLIDSFETDSHQYLVLEYCSQGDLYEAIRRGHGPLETEHVRQFMLELVDAVAFAHSKGVYHRDIKPENIFLAQDGAMKLGDWGLATTDKWSYEMTVGSDRYMAPEQFDSAGAGYGPAEADIWAIGICLLNVLFSRNPFTTPTEADPLFLDFSRDKQSLFDVFPSMSQDTYEVIVQCMNLDPNRRSLEGARHALNRVVSFTSEDESLDDFCSAEQTTVVSANREPLRTPSLQASAQFEGGAFPWAKALQATPNRHARQLSVIQDNESYTEDLFSKSGETADWMSTAAKTPSSSLLNTNFDKNMKALAAHSTARAPRSTAVSGSLPITMGKPMNLSMSNVFGRGNDGMSKSWSDMWDEEEEQETQTRAHELNGRTWSHESIKPQQRKIEQVSIVDDIHGDVDEDLVADGFFFHESATPKASTITPRYSPPSKRNVSSSGAVDKWSALGERRRASDAVLNADKSPSVKAAARRQVGFGYGYNNSHTHNNNNFGYKSHEAGVIDHHSSTANSNTLNNSLTHYHNKFWTKEQRARDRPWNKGRELNWNWRRENAGRRVDVGDIEWVGGW